MDMDMVFARMRIHLNGHVLTQEARDVVDPVESWPRGMEEIDFKPSGFVHSPQVMENPITAYINHLTFNKCGASSYYSTWRFARVASSEVHD